MTRSPLAYPLNRSADGDSGGAADLQTDIMRFMAILSLCLVAIFALVQSIPMTPTPLPEPQAQEQPVTAVTAEETVTMTEVPETAAAPTPRPPPETTVTVTRPKWVSTFVPKTAVEKPLRAPAAVQTPAPSSPVESREESAPVESEAEGFTLRFESDAALTRLVAAGQIGFYAIDNDRAQRMTVSESRISFWDASTPNTFHEMEKNTVPAAVIAALQRTGATPDAVSWGVTLPGKLKNQLDQLMLEHRGGKLIIVASGEIRWEAS